MKTQKLFTREYLAWNYYNLKRAMGLTVTMPTKWSDNFWIVTVTTKGK